MIVTLAATVGAAPSPATGSDPLVSYTLWLMLFTGVLALSTIGLWLATRKSAAIAERAAKAAAAFELPILLVTRIDLNQQNIGANEPQWELPSRGCIIFADYKNHGRTPATVLETSLEWTIANALPLDPTYKPLAASSGTIVRPEGSGLVKVGDYDITFSDQQSDALRNGTLKLWAFGFIRCRDLLGGEHVLGFCGRWQRGSERLNTPHSFVEDGPNAYRYQKYTPK